MATILISIITPVYSLLIYSCITEKISKVKTWVHEMENLNKIINIFLIKQCIYSIKLLGLHQDLIILTHFKVGNLSNEVLPVTNSCTWNILL